jgi:hypothetical protein
METLCRLSYWGRLSYWDRLTYRSRLTYLSEPSEPLEPPELGERHSSAANCTQHRSGP